MIARTATNAEANALIQVLMDRQSTANSMLRLSRTISLLTLLALSSCAALDTERNLAPIYSEHWKAGGGVETESLGGAILTHRPSVEAELDLWAVRPLFIHEWKDDMSRTEFLSPFGTVHSCE